MLSHNINKWGPKSTFYNSMMPKSQKRKYSSFEQLVIIQTHLKGVRFVFIMANTSATKLSMVKMFITIAAITTATN